MLTDPTSGKGNVLADPPSGKGNMRTDPQPGGGRGYWCAPSCRPLPQRLPECGGSQPPESGRGQELPQPVRCRQLHAQPEPLRAAEHEPLHRSMKPGSAPVRLIPQ